MKKVYLIVIAASILLYFFFKPKLFTDLPAFTPGIKYTYCYKCLGYRKGTDALMSLCYGIPFNCQKYTLEYPKPSPTPQISPTPQKFIELAKNFLIQKLGKSFYDKHVTNFTSESYKDCLVYSCNTRNRIVFHTNLPVVISGTYDIGNSKFLNMSDLIYIDVNDDSQIVHYSGPVKDSTFAITKEQAMNLGTKYNSEPADDAVLIIYQESTQETVKTYTPAWLVFGVNNTSQKGWDGKTYQFRKAVYVDTDSGNELKETTLCLPGLGDVCPPAPQ